MEAAIATQSRHLLNTHSGVGLSAQWGGYQRKKQPPTTKCDIVFTMLFTRAWVDYIKEAGYTVESVCKVISSKGEIKLSKSVVDHMCAGTNKRYVYLYKLQLMAEYVGLNLMDFVTIKEPHKEGK